MNPQKRFEASNWEVGRNAVVLALAGSAGYGLVEWNPEGSTLAAVGALMALLGFFLCFPWSLEGLDRLSLWWSTRAYKVDR